MKHDATDPTRAHAAPRLRTFIAGAVAGIAASAALGLAFGNAAPPAGRPKPTPEQVTLETRQAMEVLNQFVGRWDITGQSLDESGKPVGQFTGNAHYGFVLADNFLMGEMTLLNGDYVLEQVEYVGYSPGLGKYTHVMLTELDKSMIYQHGEWVPEASSMVFGLAAPLDTPSGTPRNVGLEYAFARDRITVTMTMQSGTKPPRTVRMEMTRSTRPAAPTDPSGMPSGGNVRMVQRQGDPAQVRAQMQEAMAQMAAQKQAVMQYMNRAGGGLDGTGGPAPAAAGLWGGQG
jgi:hypothetical protein